MPYVSSKTSVAIKKIPTVVMWKCSQCGKANAVTHMMFFQGSAAASGPVSDHALQQRARDYMDRKTQRSFKQFSRGDYRAARMQCACTGCGRREVWATHLKWQRNVSLILLLASPCLAITSSLLRLSWPSILSYLSLACLIAAFLYPAAIALINLLKVDKSRRLPKENRPTIIYPKEQNAQSSASCPPQTKDFHDPGAAVPPQPDAWTYPDVSGYYDASQQGQNTWTAPGRNGKAYSSGGTRKARIREKIIIWGGTLLVTFFVMGFLNANPTLKSFSPLVLFVAVVIVAPALCRLRDRQNGC